MKINMFRSKVKLKSHGRSSSKIKVGVSEIFDEIWYVRRYLSRDTKKIVTDMPPIEHFIKFGIDLGWQPNALFDYTHYASNVDILKDGAVSKRDTIFDYILGSNRKLISTHPLFDPLWYLQQNEDVKAEFLSGRTHPLRHFINFGGREGRQPHPLFDAKWYLETYADALDAFHNDGLTPFNHYRLVGSKLLHSTTPNFDVHKYLTDYGQVKALIDSPDFDAVSHYISTGIFEGHKPSKLDAHAPARSNFFNNTKDLNVLSRAENTWKLSDDPLVSVIIINQNGAHHLPILFEALSQQSYCNFEIIFVDNRSTDSSCSIVDAQEFTKKMLKLDRNAGFAEANNIGLAAARGELIAILNNDTRPERDWIEVLVRALQNNPNAGAATPKLRFWSKFSTLKFTSKAPFSINRDTLLGSLNYKKIFVVDDKEGSTEIESTRKDGLHTIELKVPAQTGEYELQCAGKEPDQIIVLSDNLERKSFRTLGLTTTIVYRLSERTRKISKYVINNAGSFVDGELTTSDRGFGEYDIGQYDVTERVPMLCGCAAMIRRDALLGKDIFPSEFIAYYEDSELSMRLRAAGLDIIYCPSSVVYHKHSATSVEKSRFWMKYVNRNQVIFRYMHTPDDRRFEVLNSAMMTFNHHQAHFKDSSNIKTANDKNYSEVLPEIIEELPEMVRKFQSGQIHKSRGTRIGVYNNFWQTLGGGEAHALNFVEALSAFGYIELISDDDFDLDRVTSYFGKDPDRLIKRLIKQLTPELTEEYDIFVNSCYMSECESRAAHSLYLVSFPSKTPSANFLSSYQFIANSAYTLHWMERLWGRENFDASILYPTVSPNLIGYTPDRGASKSKTILSVGRFFRTGHSKNQHIIAEIYKMFVSHSGDHEWKLVLAGSSNDDLYVEEIRSMLAGYNASVVVNIPISEMVSYYRDASIYIHAAGYGQDAEQEPEKFEHYGMTVAEAIMNGCYPIVYDAAGPQEIVQLLGEGEIYNNIDVAVKALLNTTCKLAGQEMRNQVANDILGKAKKCISITNSDVSKKKINLVLKSAGIEPPTD
ncbi:glycosyltransferase [Methylorubrum thiocyanatum]|uniref:glycosyltransferase n=1 Tax=Methylorubrum thiocyanatum TaxID=47958 RepID=UPI003F803097